MSLNNDNNNEGDIDDAMENPELDDTGSYQQRKLSAIEQVRDIFTDYYSSPPVLPYYPDKSDLMDAQPTLTREFIDACKKVGFGSDCGWARPTMTSSIDEWMFYIAYMKDLTSSYNENNRDVSLSKGLSKKIVVAALSGGDLIETGASRPDNTSDIIDQIRCREASNRYFYAIIQKYRPNSCNDNLSRQISDLEGWPIRDCGVLDNRLIEVRAFAPRMSIMENDFSDDRRRHNHSRNRYDLELHPNALEWNGQKRTSKYHDSKYPSQKSLATTKKTKNRLRNFAITQPSQSTRNNYNNRNKVTFNNQNMHKPKRTKK